MLEKLKGKKLLIIGGIPAMIEVVKRAQQFGITVYVTDYLEDSPAKKYADKSFMVSATDVEAVAALCRQENIDGIYTGNVDLLLPYYAQICEKTGLPCYGTKEQFDIMLDKGKFKNTCRQYGVPVIEEYETIDGITQYPVLVKPVDSSGSRGISICHNEKELLEGIENAKKFSPQGKYLIERYMQGDEVVLYYYIQDGNPVFAGMCDRYVIKQDDSTAQLPVAYIFPSKHTKEHMNTTDSLIKDMFRKTKMENGVVFLQGFIENGHPVLYEPGYRTNGAREQYIIGSITGVDAVDMLIHFALTGKMCDVDIEKKIDPYLKGKVGCKLSPIIGKGTVGRISGLEDLSKMDEVIATIFNHHEGSEINDKIYGTLQQIAYRSFIVTDDVSSMKEAIDQIQEKVVYYDTNGESMMLEKFDVSLLGDR